MSFWKIDAGWLPTIVILCVSNNVTGHEYWLDPVDASVETGDSVIVDVRNGEEFTGAAFPYNSEKFSSVSVSGGGKTALYSGRLGDYPAIHQRLDQPGQYSITVNSADRLLAYKSWEQFSTFLDYHGLDSIRAVHKERQLPASGVKELYRRNAKTLVQVTGNGDPVVVSPADSPKPEFRNNAVFVATGSEFEMVLLNNPYEETAEIRLRLLYDGKPLPNRQTELFWRNSHLFRFTEVTNSDGEAVFKLLGDGDYLLNAVHVIEPPANDGTHWHSRWATITFERRGFGGPGKHSAD